MQELSATSAETYELEGSPYTSFREQTQAVELISDDDESTLGSTSEPPPAYEHLSQEVDINQDGFHASVTAACELSVFASYSTFSYADMSTR